MNKDRFDEICGGIQRRLNAFRRFKLLLCLFSAVSLQSFLWQSAVLFSLPGWLVYLLSPALILLPLLIVRRLGLFRRVAELDAAKLIDVRFKTKDRAVACAGAFSSDGDSERLQLIRAQLNQMLPDADLKQLVPFKLNYLWYLAALFSFALLLLSVSLYQAKEVSVYSENIEELLKLQEDERLPEKVRQELGKLADSLQDAGSDTETLREALESARQELEKAREELESREEKIPEKMQEKVSEQSEEKQTEKSEEGKDKTGEQKEKSQENKKQGAREQQSSSGEEKQEKGSEQGQEGQGEEQGQGGQGQGQSGASQESAEKNSQGSGEGGVGERQNSGQGEGTEQKQAEAAPGEQGGDGRKEESMQQAAEALNSLSQKIEQSAREQSGDAEQKDGQENKNSGKENKGEKGEQEQQMKSGGKPGESREAGEQKKEDSLSPGNQSGREGKKEEKAREGAEPSGGQKPESQEQAEQGKSSQSALPAPGEQGTEGQGLGDKETGLQGEKGFKDADVKVEDEKFNTEFTSKKGELVSNPNEARVKTKLEDVKMARPEAGRERSSQPVPLEYKDMM